MKKAKMIVYSILNSTYKMNKNLKTRITSLLLAFIMISGLVPVEVFAINLQETNSEEFAINTIEDSEIISENYVEADTYKAGALPPVDFSTPDSTRQAFLTWYEYMVGKQRSDFVKKNLSDVEKEFAGKIEGVGFITEGGMVYGIETLDEFLPSVVKIWEDPDLKTDYYLAWLFESITGNGVEYKVTDEEYFDSKGINKAADMADIYTMDGQYYYFPGYCTTVPVEEQTRIDLPNKDYNLILNEGHKFLAGRNDANGNEIFRGLGAPVANYNYINEIHGYQTGIVNHPSGEVTLTGLVNKASTYGVWQTSLIKKNTAATGGDAKNWKNNWHTTFTLPEYSDGFDIGGQSHVDVLNLVYQNGDGTDNAKGYPWAGSVWYGNLRAKTCVGLTQYIAGQSDMHNATKTHLGAKIIAYVKPNNSSLNLGNTDDMGGAWFYLNPRYVWNKYGDEIISTGFPRDTKITSTDALGGMYGAESIRYGHPWDWNRNVDIGSVNYDWLAKPKGGFSNLKQTTIYEEPLYLDKNVVNDAIGGKYQVLNRENLEARKLLSLMATIEMTFGTSQKSEYYYDINSSHTDSIKSHEYSDLKNEDKFSEMGFEAFVKKAVSTSDIASLIQGTGVITNLKKPENLTKESEQIWRDAVLTTYAVCLLNCAAVTGYPGDVISTSGGIIEGSGYINFTMVRKNGYYASNTIGKVNYISKGVENTPLSIERDLILAGAEREDEQYGEGLNINDEYYQAGLWQIKKSLSDEQVKSLLGMTREQFNAPYGTSLGEENRDDQLYDPAKIFDMSKEKFLQIFEPVDPEKGVEINTMYVLQAGVYMQTDINPGGALETDEKGNITGTFDVNSILPASFNNDIRVAYGTAYRHDYSDTGNVFVPRTTNIELTTSSPFITNELWRNYFPRAINDTNDGYANAEYMDKIKELKGSIGNPYLTQNTLTSLETKVTALPNSGYEVALPYAGHSGGEDGGIIMGYSDKDKYKNSNSAPTPDAENDVNNIKIFRTYWKSAGENYVKKLESHVCLNIALIDTKAYDLGTIKAKNHFSETPNEELSNQIIKDIAEIYSKNIDKLAEEEAKVQNAKEGNSSGSLDDKVRTIKSSIGTADLSSIDKSKEYISNVHKGISHDAFVEVLGTDFAWMFNGKEVNINDNVDRYNDMISLRYHIRKTTEQRNLSVSYIRISEYDREKRTWTGTVFETDWEELSRTENNKKATVDLPSMGIIFDTTKDYKIEFGQTFDSFIEDPQKQHFNESLSEHPNQMYGYITGYGNKTDSNVTLNKSTTGGNLSGPWIDNAPGKNLDGGEERIAELNTVISGWNPESNYTGNNLQWISGEFFEKQLDSGLAMSDESGNYYVIGSYNLGVLEKYSTKFPDDLNNNTSSDWDSEVETKGKTDVEEVKILFKFTTPKGFDNAITKIEIIDRKKNVIEMSQDCEKPALIEDIDLGSKDSTVGTGSNISDRRYSIAVRVERKETDEDKTQNIGRQCQLVFIGNMFGNQYTAASPLVLNLATSTSSIKNYTGQVTNCSGTLSKNGDYITYYLNDLLPTGSVDICGTFIFRHYENGQLTTADKNNANNVRRGAVSWGPLDYTITNLTISPGPKITVPCNQTRWPYSGQSFVNISFEAGASYTDPNGNFPVMNNDALYTTISLDLEQKTASGSWTKIATLYRWDKAKLAINGQPQRFTMQAKAGQQVNQNSGAVSGGSMITYQGGVHYRYVARINGGNGLNGSVIHEIPSQQRVKLETNHTNNKDIAYLNVDPPSSCPQDCNCFKSQCIYCKKPHTRNTWSVTFHYYLCPSELHDSHTVCSGDPASCTTYNDCHPQGCHVNPSPITKTFYESFEILAYIKTQDNPTWRIHNGNEKIRAGQTFQFKWVTVYDTNRGDMPPPAPWGGCSYQSRTPGYSRPSANRYVQAAARNEATGDTWKVTSSTSGWRQEHVFSEFTVPANTDDICVSFCIDVQPFRGYWNDSTHPKQMLCTKSNATVCILGPNAIVEGTTTIN